MNSYTSFYHIYVFCYNYLYPFLSSFIYPYWLKCISNMRHINDFARVMCVCNLKVIFSFQQLVCLYYANIYILHLTVFCWTYLYYVCFLLFFLYFVFLHINQITCILCILTYLLWIKCHALCSKCVVDTKTVGFDHLIPIRGWAEGLITWSFGEAVFTSFFPIDNLVCSLWSFLWKDLN